MRLRDEFLRSRGLRERRSRSHLFVPNPFPTQPQLTFGALPPYSSTSPATHVTVPPPTQIEPSPSCSTWTLP